jgi:hypothetical protein
VDTVHEFVVPMLHVFSLVSEMVKIGVVVFLHHVRPWEDDGAVILLLHSYVSDVGIDNLCGSRQWEGKVTKFRVHEKVGSFGCCCLACS